MVPGVGTDGAWLGRNGEVVRGCRLAMLFGGECVPSEMPLEECAGMIYSPQDRLPSHIMPGLVWLMRLQHRGTLSGAG